MSTPRLPLIFALACLIVAAANPGADLLTASRKGQTERVAALLGRAAPLDARDKDGRTPLMLAARNGHADIVKLLLDKGADSAARDRQGWTAYGLAIFSSADGREDVLRLLPAPPRLRLGLDARWVADNLYSSCLMSAGELTQHVAAIQPEMMVAAALRDLASVSAKRMVELTEEGNSDAMLTLRVRPGAACTAQQAADQLSLAIDVKLVRRLDQLTLHEKTYGGGLKGLHVRTATNPAQYPSLYADWAKGHAPGIYWAVLEAWLRATP